MKTDIYTHRSLLLDSSTSSKSIDMKKYCAQLLLGMTTLALSTHPTLAVETLSAKELAAHCTAYPHTAASADAQFCIRYIQGFIDGAIATDERVMLNVESEFNRKESFTERALRTRRLGRDRAAEYAEYCLGQPVPLLEVVSNVVTDLQQQVKVDENVSARSLVYKALRIHYPCKPDTDD